MMTRNDRAPRRTGRAMPLRAALRLLDIHAFPQSAQQLVEDCTTWDLLRLVRRLQPQTAAALLEHVSAEEQHLLVAHLSTDRLAALLPHVSTPTAQHMLQALPPRRRAQVLQAPPPARDRI